MTWDTWLANEVQAEKRARSLHLIRSVADTWATKGRNACSEETVAAVLFRLLAAPHLVRRLRIDQGSPSSVDKLLPALPVRPFAEWSAVVDSPATECRRLAPDAEASTTEAVVQEVVRLLAGAADLWGLGDPENPETEAVHQSIVRVLFDSGLIPWWTVLPGAKP